ncbi:MAG: hypothetical protein HOA52_02470, partial [Flavobacteriales bacterium]|nr:hypothetical protein [Flavobacteriales bacterium]
MEKEIIDLLQQKASTKQAIYQMTQSVFFDFQKLLKEKSKRLSSAVSSKETCVKVEYFSKGKFEAQIKFSG